MLVFEWEGFSLKSFWKDTVAIRWESWLRWEYEKEAHEP